MHLLLFKKRKEIKKNQVCLNFSDRLEIPFLSLFLSAIIPAITNNTSAGTANHWIRRNSKTPHTMRIAPTNFVFFILNAATMAPILIAIIPTAINIAQPTNNASNGIPMMLLIKKYKKSPIKGRIRPKMAVIIVNF